MLLGKQFNSVHTPDTVTSTPGHLLQEAKVNQQNRTHEIVNNYESLFLYVGDTKHS